MDVLLIGSTGNLMQKLVDKLDKEKYRIFILTEEGKEVRSYRRAFETYRFGYDNACIREVFNSVKPDLVIFLGAYDWNFKWKKEENTSVKYSSALLNMLMAFAAQRKGRFLYLSSDEAFAGLHVNGKLEIVNDTEKHAKAQAIAMGEKMCLDYRDMAGADVVVLRLDHLYGIPTRQEEVENICAQMCMEAIDTGEITIDGDKGIYVEEAEPAVVTIAQSRFTVDMEKQFSPVYLPDAIEFIYQVAAAAKCNHSVYQVSGSTPVSQTELAELIRQKLIKGAKKTEEPAVSVVENTEKGVNSVILSGFTFMEEFRLQIFNPPEKAVPKLAEFLKKNAAQFSRRTDVEETLYSRLKRNFKELVRALVPFIENLVCFVPFFMLNNRAVDSAYFQNLDFYLLYVLLFAIVHGQQQAIFSSLLAIAGYCFRQMYQRSGFDVMLDYNTYVWMAQLLILGLAVGYMRDQLRSIREEHAEEIRFLNRQLEDMSDINGSNVRVKEVLSDHLINQNDSMGKIYEITSKLNQYQPAEVLFYAAEVLSKIMRSKDVAIYSVANRSYARLFSSTSARARELGNSVNYTEMKELYAALLEHRVYINKDMDEAYPLMASAIYEEDEIKLILMVWDIPWERMTLGQADMLAITGYLIQDAVLRANRYMAALEDQRYVHGTRILDTEAFGQLVSAFMRARSRNLTSCALLNLEVGELSEEEVNEKLEKLVRQTDYLGKDKEGSLHVLLANTDVEGAGFVKQRFVEAGLRCQVEEALAV